MLAQVIELYNHSSISQRPSPNTPSPYRNQPHDSTNRIRSYSGHLVTLRISKPKDLCEQESLFDDYNDSYKYTGRTARSLTISLLLDLFTRN